jgi:hypothetical protein
MIIGALPLPHDDCLNSLPCNRTVVFAVFNQLWNRCSAFRFVTDSDDLTTALVCQKWSREVRNLTKVDGNYEPTRLELPVTELPQ